MYLIFEIFTAASCFGLIAAFYSGYAVTAVVMKSTASVCFLIAGAYGYVRSRENKRQAVKMLAAFSFSAVGDVLLALDKDQGILFVIGVACFAAEYFSCCQTFCCFFVCSGIIYQWLCRRQTG